MGPPTPEELYERRMQVCQLRNSGKAVTEIGRLLDISQATVSKDMAWLRANGYKLGGTDLQIYENARDRARTSDACDPGRIAELRHKIITMRLEGHVPRDIARTLGIALTTVQNHIAAVYNTLTTPKAEEGRQIELDRLDYLWLALQSGINAGDPKSISAAARVSAQRAQLAGWNRPVQGENSNNIPMDLVDAEILRLSQQLDRAARRKGADIEGEVIDVDTQR